MTKEELKTAIDQEITNKTQRSSITPPILGNTLKLMVDNSGGGDSGGITPDDIGNNLYIGSDNKLNAGLDLSIYNVEDEIEGTPFTQGYLPGGVILANTAQGDVEDLSSMSHIAIADSILSIDDGSGGTVDLGASILDIKYVGSGPFLGLGGISISSTGGFPIKLKAEGPGSTIELGASGIVLEPVEGFVVRTPSTSSSRSELNLYDNELSYSGHNTNMTLANNHASFRLGLSGLTLSDNFAGLPGKVVSRLTVSSITDQYNMGIFVGMDPLSIGTGEIILGAWDRNNSSWNSAIKVKYGRLNPTLTENNELAHKGYVDAQISALEARVEALENA